MYKFLPAQKMLSIWVQQSSSGIFYEDEESILHLMWYCYIFASFWDQVQKWILGYNKDYIINLETVILGDLSSRKPDISNSVILFGKAFITKKGIQLNRLDFRSYLKDTG